MATPTDVDVAAINRGQPHNSALRRLHRDERGFSLVLIAIVSLLTIYIVVTFGFVTGIVKRARMQMETQVSS